MQKDKVSDYIDRQLKKGSKVTDIRKKLAAAGYNKADIDKAIVNINATNNDSKFIIFSVLALAIIIGFVIFMNVNFSDGDEKFHPGTNVRDFSTDIKFSAEESSVLTDAIQNEDIQECNSLPPEKATVCKNNILIEQALSNRKAEQCDMVKGILRKTCLDLFYFGETKLTGDTALCNKIASPILKDNCLKGK